MKDASAAGMTQVVRRLHRSGLGVYGMKALGSGQVTGQEAVVSALRYAFGYRHVDSVCVGITSEAELEADVAIWRRARRRSGK